MNKEDQTTKHALVSREFLGLSEAYIQQLHSASDGKLWSKTTLADSILRLSDWYIKNPVTQTPWRENWAQEAYMYYYGPLNYVRNLRVAKEAKTQNFFAGLDHFIDYGAGLGAASLAFTEQHDFSTVTHIESSSEATDLFRAFHLPEGSDKKEKTFKFQSQKKMSDVQSPKSSLLCFSFSLTELFNLPDWAYQAEAIAIIEPGTEHDGRKLLELRQILITQGYTIYAPCTHQGECPLLKNSKHDWCHDRVHFQQPEGWLKLEDKLPMKNRTLAMSYLLARKKKPTENPLAWGRLTGDLLKENGKDRQMVCFDENRIYLSWLHRHDLRQDIARGSLVQKPEGKLVSNEFRVSSAVKLVNS